MCFWSALGVLPVAYAAVPSPLVLFQRVEAGHDSAAGCRALAMHMVTSVAVIRRPGAGHEAQVDMERALAKSSNEDTVPQLSREAGQGPQMCDLCRRGRLCWRDRSRSLEREERRRGQRDSFWFWRCPLDASANGVEYSSHVVVVGRRVLLVLTTMQGPGARCKQVKPCLTTVHTVSNCQHVGPVRTSIFVPLVVRKLDKSRATTGGAWVVEICLYILSQCTRNLKE